MSAGWVTPIDARLRLTDPVPADDRAAPSSRSRLWQASKVLLFGSLLPLLVAVWFVTAGVTNPGVQDCGAPAAFILTGRQNQRVAVVGQEVTAQVRALDQQPRCTSRVRDRLILSGVAGGAFVGLALAGAVLGLVDDRRALHREPRFESFLRDEPAT